MYDFIDEDDHIYKQSLELMKQAGFSKTIQPVKMVDVKAISATPEPVKQIEEIKLIEPEHTPINNLQVDEEDQLCMFDENLKPVKPPVDIYSIPEILTKDCWETPQYIKEYIYNRFGIEGDMFDPCPANPKINGLLIDWEKCSYVNPPYSRGNQIKWIKKAVDESKKDKDVYVLIPSDTSTKIWNDYVMKYAYCIYFVRGRIKFVGASGMPKFGNALIHFNGCTLGTVVCETINFKE